MANSLSSSRRSRFRRTNNTTAKENEMSKESYARGFCKAAEAAGVDPVALAKYAQEFKTNGWAPPVVAAIGTEHAPVYGYGDDPQEGTKPQEGVDLYERAAEIETPKDIESSLYILNGDRDVGEFTPVMRARAALDPRYAAWLNAHTKATKDVAEKVSPHIPNWSPLSRMSAPDLAKAIAKSYHDSMAKSTGAVSRVSAPVAKK